MSGLKKLILHYILQFCNHECCMFSCASCLKLSAFQQLQLWFYYLHLVTFALKFCLIFVELNQLYQCLACLCFLEFICAMLGYVEFLHIHWLQQILSWQMSSGCFGYKKEEQSYVLMGGQYIAPNNGSFNINRQIKRKLLYEKDVGSKLGYLKNHPL